MAQQGSRTQFELQEIPALSLPLGADGLIPGLFFGLVPVAHLS